MLLQKHIVYDSPRSRFTDVHLADRGEGYKNYSWRGKVLLVVQ